MSTTSSSLSASSSTSGGFWGTVSPGQCLPFSGTLQQAQINPAYLQQWAMQTTQPYPQPKLFYFWRINEQVGYNEGEVLSPVDRLRIKVAKWLNK